MAENVRKFKWDGRKERAAVLLAEDELSDQVIAQEVGIADRTLWRWKTESEFMLKIAEHVQRLEAETLGFAIAKRRKRVEALDDRWGRMKQLIDARAEHYAEEIHGGETGLLVKTTRAIGSGDRQVVTEEYAVDTGLLKELREHEKQAAQEIGQWLDKSEIAVAGSGAFSIVFELIDPRTPEHD